MTICAASLTDWQPNGMVCVRKVIKNSKMAKPAPTLEYIKQIAYDAGDILREGFGQQHTIRHKGLTDLVTEIDQRSERFIIEKIESDYPGFSIVCEESGVINRNHQHRFFVDPLDGTTNYAHGMPIFSVSIAYAFNDKLMCGVVYDPMRDECFAAERGRGAWMNDHPIHVSDISHLTDALLITGFAYEVEGRSQAESDSPFFINMEYFSCFTQRAQSLRRLGSAAIDLCYIAAGRADGFWELKLGPWDVAAGSLIVEEAGGLVTDINGNAEYMKLPYSILAANPHIHTLMLPVLISSKRLE